MSSQSHHLNLPFIAAAQAQKHVTHNEALNILDALIQLSVKSCDESTPPQAPENGDRYIVSDDAAAIWSGHETEIAVFQDGAWQFYQAQTGWRAWDENTETMKVWTGQIWQSLNSGGAASTDGQIPNSVDMLGINASADETNKLVLSSSDSLFNHAGAGHQLKINKNQSTDTGALLFQDGFSGRAEIGLVGSDDLTIKVSGDGDNFQDAIQVKKDTAETLISKLKYADYWHIFNSRTLIVTAPEGENVVCIFDSTSRNPDMAYNINTGEYTAPRGGLYLMNINFNTDRSVRVNCDIVVNGEAAGRIQLTPTNFTHLSKTLFLPLEQNDVVKLRVMSGSSIRFNSRGKLNHIVITRLGVL